MQTTGFVNAKVIETKTSFENIKITRYRIILPGSRKSCFETIVDEL